MREAKTRVAGYIRVSDESQVEGHSLKAQRREIIRYCQTHGYDLVDVYSDEGVSTHTDRVEKRPELTRLLEGARQRQFSVVIVHTLDRWARNTGAQRQALQILGECDVGFASVTEDLDFTTPMGRMMLTTMGAMSEFFSDQLGVHVSKAQKQRAELGLPVGDISFGYVRNNDSRQPPEISPPEAEAVRQVFEKRVQGESHGSIATWLNGRGFQTRSGRMFTGYSVRDMLSNRFYVGIVLYRGEEYPGQHQAIVPESLFEQVQLRRAKHGRKNSKGGATGALQGMLSCGNCGNPIHSERNHQGDPRYRERHGWPCVTNGSSVIATRVDPQIGEIITGIKLHPWWRKKILMTATTSSPAMSVSPLKKQRQRIARAYGDGAYTDEDYRRRLDDIDAKILSAVPVLRPSIEAAAELLDDLPGLWREALPEERRKLIVPLVDRVYLDLKTKRISGIKPRPGFESLLGHAIHQAYGSTCALLSQDELQTIPNVGMVETGEGRTPRPEGTQLEYATGLAGYLISPCGASTGRIS